MSRQIKSYMLLAITFGVVMSCSTPALAQRQKSFAEQYKNDIEENVDAYCFKKYVGKWSVISARSDIFSVCTVTEVGDYSVITCTGGTVEYNDTDRISAFGGPGSDKAEVLCAKWYTDASCTNLIGYATPVPTVEATRESNLKVTVQHDAQEVNDATGVPGPALGTIDGRDVHYAVVGRFRSMGELNEGLFSDASIGWQALDNFTLDYDGVGNPKSKIYDLGAHDDAAVLLLRFYTGASGTDKYEVLQFCMHEHGKCIPAVSQWGVVVIALLLTAGGTIMIRRRRAMAA